MNYMESHLKRFADRCFSYERFKDNRFYGCKLKVNLALYSAGTSFDSISVSDTTVSFRNGSISESFLWDISIGPQNFEKKTLTNSNVAV